MSEQNHKDYLAARILTENRPVSISTYVTVRCLQFQVTYRLLSRALRVDVNSAKRSVLTLCMHHMLILHSMLFEFYQQQCARKPNSVHATYLVTGTKRKTEHTNGVNGRNGGDVAMRSSPFPSSMPEPEDHVNVSIKITTISLVREEELQSVWPCILSYIAKLNFSRNTRRVRYGNFNSYIQPRTWSHRGMDKDFTLTTGC